MEFQAVSSIRMPSVNRKMGKLVNSSRHLYREYGCACGGHKYRCDVKNGVISSQNAHREAIMSPAHDSRWSHIEAFMRWALTRDMIRACENLEFYILTAVPQGIHLMQAWFSHDSLITSCHFFSAEQNWDTICHVIEANHHVKRRAYFFIPKNLGRVQYLKAFETQQSPRHHIQKAIPNAAIIHTESLSNIAFKTMHRHLGTDAHSWLEHMTSDTSIDASTIHKDIKEDYLISSLCADLAVIIRLMYAGKPALRDSCL